MDWTNLSQGYDGDGLRVQRTEDGTYPALYLRSSVLGGQVVAEMGNVNGTWQWWRGYVYAGSQLLAVQQGGVFFVHEDPVTKSKRITDMTGVVQSAVELDPYGADTSRSSNSAFQPRKFTSYERDANGTDEAMARRYNRWHSRFDQPDPTDSSYDLSDPQSFNRYSYTQGDPVNFVDPSGQEACYDAWCGGGGMTWGGGYFGGDGWGSDPRPGMRIIRDDEKAFAIWASRFHRIPEGFHLFFSSMFDPQETDCERLANIVEQIANEAPNADEFMQRMVDRFIGPNLTAKDANNLERSQRIGSNEFGASGFKTQFVDTSNQVRHFTGGLWAGYLYGGIGRLGMNSNEDNTVISGRGIILSGGGILPSFWPTEDSKADVALNSVSVPLGATLTPRQEEIIDRGDRGGWRKITANPGYKGLAGAIRTRVCQ